MNIYRMKKKVGYRYTTAKTERGALANFKYADKAYKEINAKKLLGIKKAKKTSLKNLK